MLADSDWNPLIAAVLRVDRNVLTRRAKTGLWEHSLHTAYYISNTQITAERAAQAVLNANESRSEVARAMLGQGFLCWMVSCWGEAKIPHVVDFFAAPHTME